MSSQVVYDADMLIPIVQTIVVSSGIVYIVAFVAITWIAMAIFDTIDSYRWRRKMPIILAAEMIKKTEEALDRTSFEYGSDYE